MNKESASIGARFRNLAKKTKLARLPVPGRINEPMRRERFYTKNVP
jgi:hypothetical protein